MNRDAASRPRLTASFLAVAACGYLSLATSEVKCDVYATMVSEDLRFAPGQETLRVQLHSTNADLAVVLDDEIELGSPLAMLSSTGTSWGPDNSFTCFPTFTPREGRHTYFLACDTLSYRRSEPRENETQVPLHQAGPDCIVELTRADPGPDLGVELQVFAGHALDVEDFGVRIEVLDP